LCPLQRRSLYTRAESQVFVDGRLSCDDGEIKEGLTYDNFGRITSLPAADAGGSALTTSYFSNDMVASQSQGAITNTFQLDATLRQRQRTQTGGSLEGAEVFHYAGPSDSPAWTQRGSSWTRNVTGIGGELAAVQESGKEPVLQLTDRHAVGTSRELRGTWHCSSPGHVPRHGERRSDADHWSSPLPAAQRSALVEISSIS
jgi:hypothetical protein